MASNVPRPATIPISAAPSGSSGVRQPDLLDPINSSKLSYFLSRLSDTFRRSLSNQRPWYELVDRTAFSRPDSFSDATSRVLKNLSYFRMNYIFLFAITLAFTLMSHPLSLIVLLGLLGCWCFFYFFRPADAPLFILGRQFSDREAFVGLIGLTVIMVFLTSIGSLLMWAVTIGLMIAGIHAAFRIPEDIFLDDQETGRVTTGFMSFLAGGAMSAAATAATAGGPAVATKV
ncbi:Prenylated rab acceptor family protein [Zostera marina]|uniref:PRA1 family protein n=1 Tax=Zostera marina TaxID=29655 RepID=A0A0K9NL21_ZOSMR|nr:Prenylated rab acceptor family protein [Zostera marina]